MACIRIIGPVRALLDLDVLRGVGAGSADDDAHVFGIEAAVFQGLHGGHAVRHGTLSV